MKNIPLIFLLILTSFASVGAMIMAPALTQVATYFHITTAKSELMMGIFLLGYAIGQLFFGRAANTWGRIKALRVGIVIALIGALLSILGAYQHNFTDVLIGRFLNAFGSAAGLVITMTIIRDIYDTDKSRKVFSKIVLCFAIIPFLATAIGAYLTQYFGWGSINIFLFFYAVSLMMLTMFIPETLAKHLKQPFAFSKLLSSYTQLLKNSQYRQAILLQSVGTNSNYLFNAIAPLIAINFMHLTSVSFGWWSAIPATGILAGAWLSAHASNKWSAESMMKWGNRLLFVGSIIILANVVFVSSPILLFVPAWLMFFGSSLLIPNASMFALSKVTDHANGAALMNAFSIIVSSVVVSMAGKLLMMTTLSFPIMLIVIAIMGFYFLKPILRRAA